MTHPCGHDNTSPNPECHVMCPHTNRMQIGGWAAIGLLTTASLQHNHTGVYMDGIYTVSTAFVALSTVWKWLRHRLDLLAGNVKLMFRITEYTFSVTRD